jgi:hypothetical protein
MNDEAYYVATLSARLRRLRHNLTRTDEISDVGLRLVRQSIRATFLDLSNIGADAQAIEALVGPERRPRIHDAGEPEHVNCRCMEPE